MILTTASQHFQLNKWELLAAMQALAIYVIIRLGEGDTDLYNIDAVLLRAVTVSWLLQAIMCATCV